MNIFSKKATEFVKKSYKFLKKLQQWQPCYNDYDAKIATVSY